MEKLTKVSMASISIAASLVMLLAGCNNGSNTNSNSSSVSTKPVDGGTLTIGQVTKWDDEFIPYLSAGNTTQDLWSPMSFDQLMVADQKLQIHPWLAKAYTWSQDKKTLTVSLDSAAHWSDGNPITPDDVLLFMNFMASKEYNVTFQGQYEYLVDPVVGSDQIMAGKATSFADTGGFKKIDDHTFAVTFKQVDAAVLNANVSGWTPFPSHVWGKTAFKDWQNASFDKQPTVVSGPYIPTEVHGQDSVVYQKNMKYWKGVPHINSIVFKYTSESVIPSLIESKQIDMNGSGSSFEPSAFLKLKNAPGVWSHSQPTMGYGYVGLKLKNPLFSDVRVRQAMLYAIDRNGIGKGVYKGLAHPIDIPLSSVSWAAATAADGVKTYNYDPEKAKQLLDQAGFTLPVGQKWRIDPKTGKTAVFHFIYSSDSATVQAICEGVAQGLKNVGLDVILDPPMDFNTMLTKVERDDPGVQMWFMGSGLATDPDPRGTWRSTDAQNFGRWTDKQNDDLIAKTWDASAFDQSVRKQALVKWQLYVNQQVPQLIIYQRSDNWVANKKVHIPDYDWIYGPDLPNNPYEWWISNS